MNARNLAVISGACLLTLCIRFAEVPVFNFGCFAALALLCGSVIRNPAGMLIPLAVRVLSDFLIHLKTGYGFFASWPFDYAAYIVIFFAVGQFVNSKRIGTVVGGTLGSVAVYYLVSNLGVWAMTDMYPSTLAGLFECYELAVPFARGTIYGNLLFAPVFFAAWNWSMMGASLPVSTATQE